MANDDYGNRAELFFFFVVILFAVLREAEVEMDRMTKR